MMDAVRKAMPTPGTNAAAGFTTDAQKATKIVMGAYVVTGEDRKISYMQAGTPSEGQKYYSASYNDIKG